MTDTLTLRVPTDPALAVTVRVFVAESGRSLGLDASSIDDLRLVASELLASGVEHGSEAVRLGIMVSDQGWQLTATGTGSLDDPIAGDLPFRRIDLLRGIATVERVGDAVVCSQMPDAPGEPSS